MKKTEVVKKVVNRAELKDYTYAILFFLVSSFFALFVIKPVLSIAVSLNREKDDLARIDVVYEKNVLKIIDLQYSLEKIRDRMGVIDAALPNGPKIKNIVEDINKAAIEQGVNVTELTVAPVNLKSASGKLNTVSLNITVESDFQKANNFIKGLLDQRRIKSLESLKIIKQSDPATSNSYLQIQMVVNTYYL